MPGLDHVLRRNRRFYRDQNVRLMKHLSRHVNKAEGIKEIEKQKIILSLKRQLEKLKKGEINQLAATLFEQTRSGRDNTREVVVKEVSKYRNRRNPLSNAEVEETASSIYSQLKESKESQRMFEKLEEKSLRRAEKEAREQEKKTRSMGRKAPRKRRGMAKEEPKGIPLGQPAPEKPAFGAGREEQHLKEELGIGADKKGPEKEPGKKDSTFDELEKLSAESEKPAAQGKAGEDEFSMEGFSTDLGRKPKKKKEPK